MKPPISGDLFRTPSFLKIAAFFFVTVTFFFLGKHWSKGSQQLVFLTTTSQEPTTVATSPNCNKFFNISALIAQNETQSQPEKTLAAVPLVPPQAPPPPTPPPPPDSIRTFGILNENGTMSDDFEVGDFDPEVVDNWVNETQVETQENSASAPQITIKKFGLCPRNMSEYIPCLDNREATQRLKSTERGERFERHCPEKDRALNCLVPAPKGYRSPIPWPRSRDEVFCARIRCYSMAESHRTPLFFRY